MTVSLYVPEDDDVLRPTQLTLGPWSDDAQHGGPPAALLAGAAEGVPAELPMRVVRLTVELLRPVPLRPLRVSTAKVGWGRSVDRVTAALSDAASGEILATALALRIRVKPVEVPEHADDPPDSNPEAIPSADLRLRPSATFVTDAMEIRFAQGAFAEPGPATAWFRMRVPVVEGREPTPLQRVAAAADSGNGISQVAGMARLLFVNPDLTIALHRYPEGEWVCLRSVSRLEADGIGGADTMLLDRRGRIGRAYQTLLVAPR